MKISPSVSLPALTRLSPWGRCVAFSLTKSICNGAAIGSWNSRTEWFHFQRQTFLKLVESKTHFNPTMCNLKRNIKEAGEFLDTKWILWVWMSDRCSHAVQRNLIEEPSRGVKKHNRAITHSSALFFPRTLSLSLPWCRSLTLDSSHSLTVPRLNSPDLQNLRRRDSAWWNRTSSSPLQETERTVRGKLSNSALQVTSL